jgi:predicted outer membrane protein
VGSDALNQEDETFVKEAAIGGMVEVELNEIAQKSENADVKRLAHRMGAGSYSGKRATDDGGGWLWRRGAKRCRFTA